MCSKWEQGAVLEGNKTNQEVQFNTRLLHGRTAAGYGQREILPPISQVTAFQYENMEELEKVFQHKSMGYAYTRIGNPTLAAFEQKVNELEGGSGAVCCSSGMSAISTALLAVCESGDEGAPAATKVDTMTGQAFLNLAQAVVTVVNRRNKEMPKTKIVGVN